MQLVVDMAVNGRQAVAMDGEADGRRSRLLRRYEAKASAMRRRMYRGGRPGPLARVMNRLSALQFSAGLLSPRRAMTLEVAGRRTGRTVSLPIVVADYGGERYLVSMLGNDANWVRNVQAAGGRAVLRRGRRITVQLDEVEPAARAPILRRYLELAPGARAHVPVDRRAPLEEFERIADQFPVFRARRVPDQATGTGTGQRRKATT